MSSQDGVTKTRTEQLKSQRYMQVKQHLVYDNDSRPVLVFTAPIDAKDGAPCTVTEYVYRGANSTQVVDRQERDYRWKSAWEAQFTFDPTADYDPDGNGVLP